MTDQFTLSVLDQSPIREGGTAADALRESVELARLAERLGYSRYWVAEHHNTGALARTSPGILIGQIAPPPRPIRVGSGGGGPPPPPPVGSGPEVPPPGTL